MQKRIFKSSLLFVGIFIILVCFIMLISQIIMCIIDVCSYSELGVILLCLIWSTPGIIFISHRTIIENDTITKKIFYWEYRYLISNIQELQIIDNFFGKRIKLIIKGEKRPKYLYPSPINEFCEMLTLKMGKAKEAEGTSIKL